MTERKKLVVCITGASGAIYAKRLLDQLMDLSSDHEVSLVISEAARLVAREEGPVDYATYPFRCYGIMDFEAPFASGSNRFDGCVIVPCSMGTLGRIASGVSDNLITRTADVFLKERRKLILVPRETPFSLIHLRNMETLTQAGAIVMPASPSFYGRPRTLEELADTVVARVLDHLGIDNHLTARWRELENLLD